MRKILYLHSCTAIGADSGRSDDRISGKEKSCAGLGVAGGEGAWAWMNRGVLIFDLVFCREGCCFSGWGGKIVLHVNLIYEYGVSGEMGLPRMSPLRAQTTCILCSW